MSAEIDYNAVLADLEARKSQIEAAITAVRNILAASGAIITSHHVSGNSESLTPHAFLTLGIAEATKKYLGIVKSKQSLPQIVQALEKGGLPPSKPNTVYAVLRRRESQVGDIVRVGDEWGLTEWYPNNPNIRKRIKSVTRNQENGGQSVNPETPKDAEARRASQRSSQQAQQNEEITMGDATVQFLRKANKPLHISVILKKLTELGKTPSYQTLTSVLRKDRQKRFKPLGKGKFALAEWPDSILKQENKEP